jgi:hypothetical protein
MRTEDLLRYQQMYDEMKRAFGTPWLTFAHGARDEESCNSGHQSRQLRLAEPTSKDAFRAPNERGSSL